MGCEQRTFTNTVDTEMKYFVQETIGGWRQNAVFCGSLNECREYMNERCTKSNDCWNIVPESDYRVDYL